MTEQVKITTFHTRDSFGHITTWEEPDGSIWARISVNGVVTGYECIEPAREPEEQG